MCEGGQHTHSHQTLAPVESLPPPIPVIAVCGKGGVGKTAFSALLSQELMRMNAIPLLMIDADPAGGLVSTLGERSATTLAQVRSEVIESAKNSTDKSRLALADQIDYLLLEALTERKDYALLPMGLSKENGCYCPVNRLLRSAIEYLMDAFSLILIDAEAGLEQIQRQVTQRVSQIVVVVDGSLRSLETLGMIVDAVPAPIVSVVGNRLTDLSQSELPDSTRLLGCIPDNAQVRDFDRQGTGLWALPDENEARRAVRKIAAQILLSPVQFRRLSRQTPSGSVFR